MSVRYKLLALLLFISLAPLLFVAVEGRKDLTALGEGLVARSSNSLMNNARGNLKRIVEDHARILHREKQLLASGAQLVASRIEGVLYGHQHSAAGQTRMPSAEQVLAAKPDYYFQHMFGKQNLDVDFNGMDIRSRTGQLPHSLALSLDLLLLPELRDVKFEYPNLILWIDISLPASLEITYPKSASRMFARDPMYGDIEAPRSRTLSWAQPHLDRRTSLLVFSVSAPVRDPAGKILGDVTFAVPVSALLYRSPHLSMYSDNVASLLVRPVQGQSPDEGRLKVIAREQNLQSVRDRWGIPERDTWLASADTESFARMLSSMRDSASGVADMPLEDRDTLWAFAPIEPGGTSLMILVPEEDIVRDTRSVREFILAQVGKHTRNMGYVILAVVAAVLTLSLILSRLFTRSIARLAAAVGQVAHGDFSARAEVRRDDEIGQLGQAFNRMVPELEDRLKIKTALEVAQQVQQNLLPGGTPQFHGCDIAAASEYCYETGGDYYDFIPRRTGEGESLVVAVGDVSGHGIPAALMMASARAYIRSHAISGERLDQVAMHANELSAADLDQTGRFMTAFLLELLPDRSIRWVRAGHDPAFVYSPAQDRFGELKGEGLPLGVLRDAYFALNELPPLPSGLILILGTDGIWETNAPDGRMFGKERFKDVLRKNSGKTASGIIQAVTQALDDFRGGRKKADDMTIAIVKIP